MTHKTDSFCFDICLPSLVYLQGVSVRCEDIYAWVWTWAEGLLGIYEGSMMLPPEVERWDVAREDTRDWVGDLQEQTATLYFMTSHHASHAQSVLASIPDVTVMPLRSQQDEDWDAQWKASFLENFSGFSCFPFLILPAFKELPSVTGEQAELLRVIRINPGAGFGTGTHATTQLCCEAIVKMVQGYNIQKALDFGTGSGVLAILLRHFASCVHAVDVDSMAIENAKENEQLSGVQGIEFFLQLPHVQSYDVIVANILRPVLIAYAEAIVARLADKALLVLSGLLEEDVIFICEVYQDRYGLRRVEDFKRDDWVALVFQK